MTNTLLNWVEPREDVSRPMGERLFVFCARSPDSAATGTLGGPRTIERGEVELVTQDETDTRHTQCTGLRNGQL
ncbi:MAG: hypothetical protein PVJ26_09400, partial [Anaerolineae bacterium]